MPPRRQQSTNNVNTNSEGENGATTRIESMACRALDGTTGMCYSKNECAELDGRSVGLCDDDSGDDGPVCCIGELVVSFFFFLFFLISHFICNLYNNSTINKYFDK
jgi:hypothetical protein